ncbi:MAG: hypothetical protein LUG83_03310 [Lachnospiraceae bacterium]|nr:hypothetical protein [Lachnospiraceae bacterium]
MKKSTTKVTIIIICLVAAMVGYYAYLSNRSYTQRSDSSMTFVQSTLARDLENDYPATVKEVMKYYNDVMRCFYGETCTDEELEELGYKVRALYDDELLEANEPEAYMERLKSDISAFKEAKRSITSYSVAASTSVDYYTADDFYFARILCGYNMVEGGVSTQINTIYLLRRDENRRWRIYGWESADAYEAAQESQESRN